MAESPHVPSVHRFSRPWALSLATLGAMLAIQLGSVLLWRDRLPDPVATHWTGTGVADGTGSLATHLILGVATLGRPGVLVPLAARSLAGRRSAESLLSALGNGLLVANRRYAAFRDGGAA